MFDIGGGELILILVVVLLLFGPKKLPELMQGLGKGIREFKKAQHDFTEHINSAFEEEQRKSYRDKERNETRRDPNTIARGAEEHPAESIPVPPPLIDIPMPPLESEPAGIEEPIHAPEGHAPEGTVAKKSMAANPVAEENRQASAEPLADPSHNNDTHTNQNS